MQQGFVNKYNMYKSTEKMKCETIENGIVLPQKFTDGCPMWGAGGVCDASNHFVSLSEYHGGWAEHGAFYSWEEETYCDEDVVYFGLFFKHWGHFLVDLIGRLWFFSYHNPDSKKYKLVYIGEEEPSGNYLEFLELLGIESNQLIHVTKPTRFKSVVVSQFASRPCIWFTDEYQSIFKKLLQTVEDEHYKYDKHCLDKVYFTRLNFSKAIHSEIGEEQIAKWMKANGYSLISPETLSLRDQIYIWNHASKIACIDGSIPINVGFSFNKDLDLLVLHKTSLVHKNLDLYLLMSECNVTLLDIYREPVEGYPKSIGEGPFLLSITEDVKEYSEMNGMIVPFTEKEMRSYDKKNYRAYLRMIANVKGKVRNVLSKMYHRVKK